MSIYACFWNLQTFETRCITSNGLVKKAKGVVVTEICRCISKWYTLNENRVQEKIILTTLDELRCTCRIEI